MNPKAKWLAITLGAVAFASFFLLGLKMAADLDALPRAMVPVLVESGICGIVAALVGYGWGTAFPPRKRDINDPG